jgi:hypothetical protein
MTRQHAVQVPHDLSGSAITSRSTLALSRAGDATGHAKPPTSDEFSPPHARPKRLGDEGIVSTQMGSLIGTETSFALQHEMRSDVRFGSMSLKKSEMRVAELSIGAFLASFSLDRRP